MGCRKLKFLDGCHKKYCQRCWQPALLVSLVSKLSGRDIVSTAKLSGRNILSTADNQHCCLVWLVNASIMKPEMHSRKKVQKRRWRAIWNCSVQAELTIRLLHELQNKTEIMAFQIGFTHSRESQRYLKALEGGGFPFPDWGNCPATLQRLSLKHWKPPSTGCLG